MVGIKRENRPNRKGVKTSAATGEEIRCRKIMAKENLSRKLVSRWAVAVLAVVLTFTCYTGSSTSDPDISVQEETSQTSETTYVSGTADTVELTMATYRASQGETASLVTMPSETTSASTPAETTTTTSATTASETTSETAGTSATKSTKTRSTNKVKSDLKSGVTTTTRPAVTTAGTSSTTAETTVFPNENLSDDNGFTAPVLSPERTIDSDYTHPYGKQTKSVKLHWNAVSGASRYLVYVKNGQYADWTSVASTPYTDFTVTSLRRDTEYLFAVRAVDDKGNLSSMSDAMNIKTARMDYSKADWQAMCRIVFHEVGGAAGSFWDRPIVYVADCVTNQYVCAKYTKTGVWAKYYRRYPNIASIIYTSGGFLSDAGLTARGATYSRVSHRVKLAVWGATYGVTTLKGIKNDYNVFYWCNSGSYKSSSKVAYNFRLPWGGYMQIWRRYWG